MARESVHHGGRAMTGPVFCRSGEAEVIKGGVHVLAATILGVMAAYNGLAWLHRRERHLAWNTVLYAAGVVFEVRQSARHMRRIIAVPREPARGATP